MATRDEEAIETFMSITGVSKAIAIQKLEEHRGDLNEAVNAHFSEVNRNSTQGASFNAPQDDFIVIDDPIQVESHRPPSSLFPFARDFNPFPLFNPNFTRSIFDRGTAAARSPFIDDNDVYFPNPPITNAANSRPGAPTNEDVLHYGNDIEEEMIRAAIEASKHETAMSNQDSDYHLDQRDLTQPGQFFTDDPEIARAVSLSLQTAEQEKVLRELEGNVGAPDEGQKSDLPEEMGKVSSSIRRVSSGAVGIANNNEVIIISPPSSPQQHEYVPHLHQTRNPFPSEWVGISSEEHDEAVMLEAAMFGGIPEEAGYHFPYAPHQHRQNGLGSPRGPLPSPRPPSPSLVARRLIREHQDDEYLAALQADKERELKAKEEAEAALAAENRKEKELHRKLQAEQEIEKLLVAKEASLPREPTVDDENALTLLVRMPDGSRRGRRFLKFDKLQCLFDFIDVGRVVKPGSYRLVRPYPRRAFSDGESTLSLHELGLTSKHEALYLELI